MVVNRVMPLSSTISMSSSLAPFALTSASSCRTYRPSSLTYSAISSGVIFPPPIISPILPIIARTLCPSSFPYSFISSLFIMPLTLHHAAHALLHLSPFSPASPSSFPIIMPPPFIAFSLHGHAFFHRHISFLLGHQRKHCRSLTDTITAVIKFFIIKPLSVFAFLCMNPLHTFQCAELQLYLRANVAQLF